MNVLEERQHISALASVLGAFIRVLDENEAKRLSSKVKGDIMGIPLGVARELISNRLCHAARALEIFAELGLLGTVMTRQEFLGHLSGYMEKESEMSSAFEELSGRSSNRHKRKKDEKIPDVVKGQKPSRKDTLRVKVADRKAAKKYVAQLAEEHRQALLEFFVKKCRDIINTSGFSQNTQKTSKRGRKGEGRSYARIYIPTEEELREGLLESGVLDPLNTRPKSSKVLEKSPKVIEAELEGLCSDLYTEYPKPLDVLKSGRKYKAHITNATVFEGGEKPYARKTLARKTGVHPSTARKYAELGGIKVTPNEPKRREIHELAIKKLPVDKEELDLLIEAEELPEGIHIRNDLEEKFPFTQAGAGAAIESSTSQDGKGLIFEVIYSASTYDPKTSPYYIGEKQAEPQPEPVRKEKYELPKKLNITGFNKEIRLTHGAAD